MSDTKTAYTPGRLWAGRAETVRRAYAIRTDQNIQIADAIWDPYLMDGGAEEAEANARRLVACWNALEGIPTETIEAGIVADLLAALEDALGYIVMVKDAVEKGDTGHRFPWPFTEEPKIRTAIARAKEDTPSVYPQGKE